MKGFGGVNFYLLFDLFSPLDRFEHLLFYGFVTVKVEATIINFDEKKVILLYRGRELKLSPNSMEKKS